MLALFLLPFMLFDETELIVCRDLTRINQEVWAERASINVHADASFLHNDGAGGPAGENLAPGTCSPVNERFLKSETRRELSMQVSSFRLLFPSSGDVKITTQADRLRGRTMLLVERFGERFRVNRMMTLEERRSYKGEKLVGSFASTLYACETKCIFDRNCEGFNFLEQGSSGQCTLLRTLGPIEMRYIGPGSWSGIVNYP